MVESILLDIGVEYKEDPDQVIEIINQVGTNLQMDELFGEQIIEPIEFFGLDRFEESEIYKLSGTYIMTLKLTVNG